jgi:hypothetical protein
MNLESAGRHNKALYAVSGSVTSYCMVSVQKFSRVPKVTGKRDLTNGGHCYPWDYAVEGSLSRAQ